MKSKAVFNNITDFSCSWVFWGVFFVIGSFSISSGEVGFAISWGSRPNARGDPGFSAPSSEHSSGLADVQRKGVSQPNFLTHFLSAC